MRPAAVALAWCLRDGNTSAIPKAASVAHARDHAASLQLRLIPQHLADIDAAHAPPRRKESLAML